MKRFHVQQNELHVTEYAVQADNAEEAAQKVLSGDGTLITTEYASVLDSMAGAGLPPSIRDIQEINPNNER